MGGSTASFLRKKKQGILDPNAQSFNAALVVKQPKDRFYMTYDLGMKTYALLEGLGIAQLVFMYSSYKCGMDDNKIIFNLEGRVKCAEWINQIRLEKMRFQEAEKAANVDRNNQILHDKWVLSEQKRKESMGKNYVEIPFKPKKSQRKKAANKPVTERAVLRAINVLKQYRVFIVQSQMVFIVNPYMTWRGHSSYRRSLVKQLEKEYIMLKGVKEGRNFINKNELVDILSWPQIEKERQKNSTAPSDDAIG